MWECGFDGSAGLSVLRIPRGGESGGAVETRVGHSAGGSAAIVVAVFLVAGLLWLIIPWIVAWSRRASFETAHLSGAHHAGAGSFLQSYREFDARDIRSVEIDQSIMARMVGIGDLTISTAATVDAG